MDTLANLISTDASVFEESLDEKRKRDTLLLGVARNLPNYLNESLDLIAAEMIRHVPILDILVRELRDDITGLRKMLQPLNSAGLGTEHYGGAAQELLAFYKSLRGKYMVYQQILDDFSRTPPPPSQ